MSTLLQIVPRRSTVPDGIGDFATRLAEGLKRHDAVRSVFLQAASSDRAPPREDGWHTEALREPSADLLGEHVGRMVAHFDARAILLHVSGYGFHRRGAPHWLAEGIRKARATAPSVPLIGFFHELWVEPNYRPWRSSFWLRGQQRTVTRALYSLCDHAITSTELYRDMLRANTDSSAIPPVERLAVFSNVGEPHAVTLFERRPSHLAAFAGSGIGDLLRTNPVVLRNFLAQARIAEIFDIGARLPAPPANIDGIPVRALGRLQADAVSEVLAHCRYGAFRYESIGKLAKSGTFAAYAAHGVVPVLFDTAGREADGLAANRHYVHAETAGQANPTKVAVELHRWYADHSVARHAGAIGGIVLGLRTEAA